MPRPTPNVTVDAVMPPTIAIVRPATKKAEAVRYGTISRKRACSCVGILPTVQAIPRSQRQIFFPLVEFLLEVGHSQLKGWKAWLSAPKEQNLFNGNILVSIDALLGLLKPFLQGWIQFSICVIVEAILPDRTVVHLVGLSHLIILLPDSRRIGLILQEEVEIRHEDEVV